MPCHVCKFVTIIPDLDAYESSDEEEEVCPAPLPQKRKRSRLSYADKLKWTKILVNEFDGKPMKMLRDLRFRALNLHQQHLCEWKKAGIQQLEISAKETNSSGRLRRNVIPEGLEI